MSPLEMIKEGVKSKSWALVKAALKELEEKQLSLEEYPSQATENFRLGPHVEVHDEVKIPTKKTKKEKAKSDTNLFYDDGTTTKVGNVTLDSAQADLKIKYKKPTERNRAPHVERKLSCSRCNKQYVLSDIEYSFYKNPENEYICQKCI